MSSQSSLPFFASSEQKWNYVCDFIKDNAKLLVLIEDALDWSHCFGLVLRTAEHKNRSDYCQNAPFALFPSPFPRELFEEALEVQPLMNELYFRIAWDVPFLLDSHLEVIKTDNFTKRLLNILKTVHQEGIRQKVTLLTQRADYMCHVETGSNFQLKQIEVNNIAVSMGALAQTATKLHRHVLAKFGYDLDLLKTIVPENEPVRTLVSGLYSAWKLFNNESGIVLIVIEETNQNQLDQKFIEYELEKVSNGKIQCLRLTFQQCFKRLSLADDYSLLVDDEKAVSVVYFRAGYSPHNYPTDSEWEARLTIERSIAIKCPSIGLHLANTKKIQQVLDREGEVERYFPGRPEASAAIRKTFAGLWGLDSHSKQTADIIQDAIKSPEKYVLKPQLEGGGGNYYGDDIIKKLNEFSFEQRASHILMQKITPLVVKNYLVRAFQEVKLENVVSELGVYGALLGNGEDMSIQMNECHGHILRSKSEKINEGGVAIGAAVIDTPYLMN